MTNKSTMLLEHNLKQLKLPTFLREYDKLASQCASEGADHPDYLLRLSELELIDRHHRMVERRIKAARFPTTKSLDTFDFLSMPSLNKALVLELARCEYIERPHNVIALGNSGTGKTHIALGLGLAACQRGLSVGFTTAAALVHELIEARDERRLLNLQRRLARLKLLIIDELGFVPLSKTGAELLFEVFSQRYERGSVLVTSNLPFVEWTEVFGSERLTGALLDRLTHHVDILEMNGDSYRSSTARRLLAASYLTEPDLQRPTNLDAHSTAFSGTVLLRPACNCSAIMSSLTVKRKCPHEGACDIDAERADKASGSQQFDGGPYDHGAGSDFDGSERAPHQAYSGGLQKGRRSRTRSRQSRSQTGQRYIGPVGDRRGGPGADPIRGSQPHAPERVAEGARGHRHRS